MISLSVQSLEGIQIKIQISLVSVCFPRKVGWIPATSTNVNLSYKSLWGISKVSPVATKA